MARLRASTPWSDSTNVAAAKAAEVAIAAMHGSKTALDLIFTDGSFRWRARSYPLGYYPIG